MENWSLLVFGILVGMQHALEADHLAAVAALSTGRSSRRGIVLRGAWWGIGHTIALFGICGTAIVLGLSLESRVEAALEFCVGVMVALLGLNVLRTMLRRRIHFHAHDHGDGVRHIHAHSHRDDTASHTESPHRHRHPDSGLIKAAAIGLLHGAAGSGALLVLIVAASKSLPAALAYIGCFGIGSIIGMAALSFVASFPLKAAERNATWLNTATMGAIGLAAVAVGSNIAVESWRAFGF